jgi:hypothetical protein
MDLLRRAWGSPARVRRIVSNWIHKRGLQEVVRELQPWTSQSPQVMDHINRNMVLRIILGKDNIEVDAWQLPTKTN